MEFNKGFLQDLWLLDDQVEIIKDEIYETSRWSEHHMCVFKYNNSYYVTYYSQGTTEMQEEYPYEDDPDEIECDEVFLKTKEIEVFVNSEGKIITMKESI